MKILLLGEYSNVHWTLACGLRSLGHQVTVISNGDFWKQYKCDILLKRDCSSGIRFAAFDYYLKVLRTLPLMRGYDVVQIINPMFLELKAERIWKFYRYLRRHNGKIYLGAFGMDHYYVKGCLEGKLFRYSELVYNNRIRAVQDNLDSIQDWNGNSAKAILNRKIAKDCNGIVAGLWEYFQCYRQEFGNKLAYIPFPVEPVAKDMLAARYYQDIDRIRFFIGIQKTRSEFKGTDILLKVLQDLSSEYPDKMELVSVCNVPFEEYKKQMRNSDILVDQLYSPSPNMNSLLAMSQGLVVAGGGWEEPYNLLGESELRPVIDLPCEPEQIRKTLLEYINNPERVKEMKKESVEYINRYHIPSIVASRWIEFTNR